MQHSDLFACPGCGALFPPYDGPAHKYLGASAGCWALFSWSVVNGGANATGLLAQSKIPERVVTVPTLGDTASLDTRFGDAYVMQHHGE